MESAFKALRSPVNLMTSCGAVQEMMSFLSIQPKESSTGQETEATRGKNSRN